MHASDARGSLIYIKRAWVDGNTPTFRVSQNVLYGLFFKWSSLPSWTLGVGWVGTDPQAATFCDKGILISLNRGICQVLWEEGWTNLVNVKTPPHTLVHLCRSLHEKVDAQLIGELARLLLCYHPLVRSVRHEDLAEIFRDSSNVRLDIDQDIGRGSSMPGASGYTY